MRRIPDIVTSMRMIGAAVMLLIPVEGLAFQSVYSLCGVSDMLDGFLARKLNYESEAGARLDSLADILFCGACIWKLIPQMTLPSWAWAWIAVIAGIRIVNVISSLMVHKKVILPHTRLNRLTGLMLFIMVPFIFRTDRMIIAAIPCIVATVAAIEEGHLVRTGRTSL